MPTRYSLRALPAQQQTVIPSLARLRPKSKPEYDWLIHGSNPWSIASLKRLAIIATVHTTLGTDLVITEDIALFANKFCQLW